MNWTPICKLDKIPSDGGVAALVEGRQVAIFRLADDALFAIDNFDPCSGANVLSRGIVGDLKGAPVVASPIYKQHFRLRDGFCIEAPACSVAAHAVKLVNGEVQVALGHVVLEKVA